MITYPTAHLNGTSKERLLEAVQEAHQAIITAQEKLAETAPNARDYPPGQGLRGPNARYWRDTFIRAGNEHRARMQKLTDVKAELEILAGHIDSQGR